ncbi:MAG: LysM peptidoglycan-binding domain-containing protein [Hymenobacteraceae bacterium]|nr:LysM peptidoglycan-binding domain-containing protein [Hymenobacteraceae bacterium]
MGLRDFFRKGEEKPAAETNPQQTGGFFGNKPEQEQHKYTVVSGDSLSKIAQREYGDAMQWRKIYDANRDVIGDNPDLIHPGQELVIPEKEK